MSGHHRSSELRSLQHLLPEMRQEGLATLAPIGCAGSPRLGMSRGRLDLRKSTCRTEVAQATPPKVSIALITLDVAEIECTRLTIVDSDMPHRQVRPPVVFRERMRACSITMSVDVPRQYRPTCQTVEKRSAHAW